MTGLQLVTVHHTVVMTMIGYITIHIMLIHSVYMMKMVLVLTVMMAFTLDDDALLNARLCSGQVTHLYVTYRRETPVT